MQLSLIASSVAREPEGAQHTVREHPNSSRTRQPGLTAYKGRDEIRSCQRLRYRVFYEELSARPSGDAAADRIDADRFDSFCDHLVVVQTQPRPSDEPILLSDGELVGTYRLLRQEVAEANGGFYTQDEFDIAPVIKTHPNLRFLELGRSCVLKPYRTRPVVELLWQGIWDYVRAYDLHVMMGCASIEGTDPELHADTLSFFGSDRRRTT